METGSNLLLYGPLRARSKE